MAAEFVSWISSGAALRTILRVVLLTLALSFLTAFPLPDTASASLDGDFRTNTGNIRSPRDGMRPSWNYESRAQRKDTPYELSRSHKNLVKNRRSGEYADQGQVFATLIPMVMDQ